MIKKEESKKKKMKMSGYEFYIASSLEKVFPDRRPAELEKGSALSLWGGTCGAVQLVYTKEERNEFPPQMDFEIEVNGAPCKAEIRKVELIPSDFPCYEIRDEHYITDKPGMFPDLLKPVENTLIKPLGGQYRSLWISFPLPEDVKPGDYKVEIKARAIHEKRLPNGVLFQVPEAEGLEFTNEIIVRVGKMQLPEQSLIHTEWLHTDSIADYYGTEIFDERHWGIIEKFIDSARKHNVNMLLTPVFTPPLDTEVGCERRTVQLVDITKVHNKYEFNFEKLRRWCELCKKHGIKYLEIPHFFTQWGAAAAPKIVADLDGREEKIFGWETSASGKEYREFLKQFIPALQKELGKLGYDKEHVYYHISDEPSEKQIEAYKAARETVCDLLPEDKIIDALSSLKFYQEGIIPHPVPGTSEVDEFYEAGVENLWVYYCCAQAKDVPNRFFAMESARNRIMGVLMYLYNIKGFLHWGFNYYYTQYTKEPVDPFVMTHAGYAFASGDAFLVYPGKDGEPLDSIRAEVQDEGLTDLRALQVLETLTDRKYVENIIYEKLPEKAMNFKNYPHSSRWLLELRERIGEEIEKVSEHLFIG